MLVCRFVCRMICLINCPQICFLALLLVISWQKFITFVFYQHIGVCFPLLPFLHVSCHYEHWVICRSTNCNCVVVSFQLSYSVGGPTFRVPLELFIVSCQVSRAKSKVFGEMYIFLSFVTNYIWMRESYQDLLWSTNWWIMLPFVDMCVLGLIEWNSLNVMRPA